MKNLIFLAMLSALIFIGCEDTCNVTEPGSDGIELEWIYASDNMMDELYYTHDNQIILIDTTYNHYGLREIYEATGNSWPSWDENDLIKCDKIQIFIYDSQNSYFTYSYDILPDVLYTRAIILDWYVWKEK